MTMTPATFNGQDGPGRDGGGRPDPGANSQRRTFTADYKLATVEEYDAGNAAPRKRAEVPPAGAYPGSAS